MLLVEAVPMLLLDEGVWVVGGPLALGVFRGDLVGSILRPALREGKVLYERV